MNVSLRCHPTPPHVIVTPLHIVSPDPFSTHTLTAHLLVRTTQLSLHRIVLNPLLRADAQRPDPTLSKIEHRYSDPPCMISARNFGACSIGCGVGAFRQRRQLHGVRRDIKNISQRLQAKRTRYPNRSHDGFGDESGCTFGTRLLGSFGSFTMSRAAVVDPAADHTSRPMCSLNGISPKMA